MLDSYALAERTNDSHIRASVLANSDLRFTYYFIVTIFLSSSFPHIATKSQIFNIPPPLDVSHDSDPFIYLVSINSKSMKILFGANHFTA